MSFYSYKRVRELIPQHLADKYQKEWTEEHESADGKEFRIEQFIRIGNSPERAEELYNLDEWFWDNEYNGDLFDAAADYIVALEREKAKITRELEKWQEPFDQERLDAVKEQASHADSLCAQRVYITALEHALKHHVDSVSKSEPEAYATRSLADE